MSDNNYTVYIHINKINNKKYIGITSQTVNRRWRSQGQGYKNCKLFYRAIQKYGWNNFDHTILYTDLNEQEAKSEEKRLIAKYQSNNPRYGYNLTDGGEHYVFSEEAKRHISEGVRKNPPHLDHDVLSRGQKRFWASVSDEYRKQWGEMIKKQNEDPELKKRRCSFMSSDRNPRLQPVKCVETGICYRSNKEAAQAMGGAASTFYNLWSGRQKTAWGYHWEKITLEEYYEYQSC